MADDVIPPAGEDENLVVDLSDDDTSGGVKTAKPPPVPGPGSSQGAAPAPQAGLEELQRQIEAERAERTRVTQVAQQIARERDQAIQFAQEAERKGVSSYELYNENQIKATQDKMESLAGQAEQAMNDGDFKRASTINLQIGRLGGALAVLERDQAVLAQQREQQPQRQAAPQQAQPAAQPAQSADPLERAIASRTEPTKQFLRKHPELVRGDGTLKASAIAAHERARDDGYEVDTPAYFDYIEKSLQAQVPTPGRAPAASQGYAAPVARSSAPTASGSMNGGTFTMTPKMRRLAAEQGVSDKEWAQNYVRLLAEGRITEVR